MALCNGVGADVHIVGVHIVGIFVVGKMYVRGG
jgi:hypothetical protein